ncbi:MAG: ComEC/Rec2 family competence protein [Gemmatimonadota bacterium]
MKQSHRNPGAPRALTVFGMLACLACGAPGQGGTGSSDTLIDTAQQVELIFLDVGQGDATLIRTPEGRTALIDAGRSDPTPQLRAAGIERIDLVVASHPHADHIGGIEAVLAAFPVGAYMDNGQTHTTATYLSLMRTLRARPDISYLEAVPRTITLGSVTLEVLPLPPPDEVDHNDRSIGLVLRFGRFTAFLSGDSERRQLAHFLEHGAVPASTVLKAPHHGSRNGFTMAFLQAARPQVVVIPLGTNSYGHPHQEALEAYGAVARNVYRTDLHGAVSVLGYEDGRYVVSTER